MTFLPCNGKRTSFIVLTYFCELVPIKNYQIKTMARLTCVYRTVVLSRGGWNSGGGGRGCCIILNNLIVLARPYLHRSHFLDGAVR